MENMRPLPPMKQMEPMQTAVPWWPPELGDPSISGSADDVGYAYFPEKRRLAIERNGRRRLLDTADHQLTGALQQTSPDTLYFLSQHGPVDVDALTAL
jgi:hypothetical protein